MDGSAEVRGNRGRVVLTGTLVAVLLALRACTESSTPEPSSDGTDVPARSVEAEVEERTIYLWDPNTGDVDVVFSTPASLTTQLADAERSPDGRYVAYERQPPGTSTEVYGIPPQIYLLDADGTERRLTNLAGGAHDPTWSPDGTTIAFAGAEEEEGSDLDIFTIDVADGMTVRVARTPGDDQQPDWSPDGTRLVFDSRSGDHPSAQAAIWVTSVATHELRRLTPRRPQFASLAPTWSPDGRWIVHRRFDVGLTINGWPHTVWLYLMRPDGSHTRQIEGLGGYNRVMQDPSWSPDGRSIVIEQSDWRERRFALLLVDPRTGRRQRVLGGHHDAQPSWGTEGILMTLWSDDPVPSEPAPSPFTVQALTR